MKTKRLRTPYLILSYWQTIITFLLVLSALVFVYWYKIGSLPGGISEAEGQLLAQLNQKTLSLRGILENPLFMPHKIGMYLLEKLGFSNVIALRSLSATIALGVIGTFYLLISRWHNQRIAIYSTIMFSLSSWLLHTGRYGGTDIVFSLLLTSLLFGMLLQYSRYRKSIMLLLVIITATVLYTPGGIWFVVAGAIWQRKRFIKELGEINRPLRAAISGLGLALVAPLLWCIYRNPRIAFDIFALPSSVPPAAEFIKNLSILPFHLFVRAPVNPELWLGNLPLLDFFSSIMFVVGIYWYSRHFALDRTKVMLAVILFGGLLFALGGSISLSFFMPFVYVVIAAGLSYISDEWFKVFPRNPLARFIGTALISIAVMLSAVYSLTHYFVAWPNAPETRKVYSLQE